MKKTIATLIATSALTFAASNAMASDYEVLSENSIPVACDNDVNFNFVFSKVKHWRYGESDKTYIDYPGMERFEVEENTVHRSFSQVNVRDVQFSFMPEINQAYRGLHGKLRYFTQESTTDSFGRSTVTRTRHDVQFRNCAIGEEAIAAKADEAARKAEEERIAAEEAAKRAEEQAANAAANNYQFTGGQCIAMYEYLVQALEGQGNYDSAGIYRSEMRKIQRATDLDVDRSFLRKMYDHYGNPYRSGEAFVMDIVVYENGLGYDLFTQCPEIVGSYQK